MQLELLKIESNPEPNQESVFPECRKTCRLWDLFEGDFDCRDACPGKVSEVNYDKYSNDCNSSN